MDHQERLLVLEDAVAELQIERKAWLYALASFANSLESNALDAFAVHLHELLGKEADKNLKDGHSDNLLPLARLADQIEDMLIKP
ncbi:hypothetical protein [Loktanella sp. M215]|uniref:hypothetical protein n=1 Tax=Loktanella sp. M215 TaxID=2675431 RepID=UPI001F336C92|nr:hypothetical protein [Loktanella sp. M215]MCF7699352.1 hypothetical protein [Loktanella sp. M215]